MSDNTHDPSVKNEVSSGNFIFKVISSFVKGNPMVIFCFVLFLIIVMLQDLALPHFTGKLVSAIQGKQPLIRPFLYILGIILSIQTLYSITEWQDALLFPSMQGHVRDKIMEYLLDVHSSNYAELDVAGVLMRAIKLPSTLFTFLDQMRYYFAPYMIVYVITIGYIAYHDVLLGVIVLISIVILYGAVLKSPKSCEAVAFNTERKSNMIADEMEDIMSNLMSVYSQNQQEEEKQRIRDKQTTFLEEQKRMARCIYKIKFMMFPFMGAFIAIFMYRCYRLVKSKRIDAGKFVALFMILSYVANSMWRMINQLRDSIPRWGRIREGLTIFDPPPETMREDSHHTNNTTLTTDGIYIDNVFFKYPQSNSFILKGMTLHIPNKQNIAIIGRIGCGKSTLLKLIMKYYEPTRGEVFWRGIPYKDMTADQVRAHVGYVHQYPSLFKRSIYENIIYGLNPEQVTREAINDILKHINMDGIFSNVPNGLDGDVGRKGSKLSGGQKQMVWLLRTFFKSPDILILDEPTASVDAETKNAIQKMLELIMKDKTVIIVTHDPFLLNLVDRVVTVESGIVVSDKQLPKKWGPNIPYGHQNALSDFHQK